ncbi:dr1-associated corepressor-like [Montipora capricornis]|uniref:dr1-associated corepressor-like n=1 Tax=Montipora foliosa TaxID=591990 RepID=UPI0035F19287
MPSKKKKFNARFPPARIKKIMQTDEDVGKVAAAVPVIISKALEMFLQSLVERASEYTRSRNAKTMTPAHLKRCITSENQFDFLKDLVANVPDLPSNEEEQDGEPKPKRKRAPKKPPAQNKERKKSEKRKPQPVAAVSDESEDELESEEEDSSSEGTSNHTSATNSTAKCSSSTSLPSTVPSITLTRPSTDENEESKSSASMSIPMLGHIPGMMGNSFDDEDDDYDS